MTTARAFDLRFLLAELPRTVTIAGVEADDETLSRLGLERVFDRVADVAFVSGDASTQASAAAIVSFDANLAIPAGYATRSIVCLPSSDAPELAVDRRSRSQLVRGVQRTFPSSSRIKASAKRSLMAAGLVRGEVVTIAERVPGEAPAILRAARTEGLLVDVSQWYAAFDPGWLEKLGAFVVAGGLGDGRDAAVTFTRTPGQPGAIDREEAGVARATALGLPLVTDRMPRWAGRTAVDGHHAAVMEAARGVPLDRLLWAGRGGASVEHIANWIIEVGRVSARRGDDATVFAHGDLNTANVFVDGSPDRFTVIDWEHAAETANPMLDLVYFAVHALPILDGARTDGEVDEHLRGLWSGTAPSSPRLRAWLERQTTALGLERERTSALLAAVFDHYLGILAARRRHESTHAPPLTLIERAASAWRTTTDPRVLPSPS